jgi:zinc/manganese transport system substrate-binding protein
MLDIGAEADVLKTQETPLTPPTGTAPADAAKPLVNPHIWLDPLIQINAANRIRDALITLDPADKATFEANAAKYDADLQKLHADFKTACAAFPKKEFIGFHSAYAYLARRYGLRQVASLEEVPEQGLSRAQIDRVIALIKDQHITVLFTEDAFPVQAANEIATATRVQLGVLQPLETYTSLKDTYVSLMRKNLEELTRTLGH